MNFIRDNNVKENNIEANNVNLKENNVEDNNIGIDTSFFSFGSIFRKILKRVFKTAFLLLILLTILTGVIYPVMVTGIAQVFFKALANGSLIVREGKAIGSEWIGQSFEDPRYFWGRPSATMPIPYNAMASKGSNIGPINPILLNNLKMKLSQYQNRDPKNTALIPIELLSSSASGLDPHISPISANYQVSRIAKVRQLPEKLVYELVKLNIEKKQFFILGEPRVNVLLLNLALDELEKKTQKTNNRKLKNARKT